MEKKGLGPMTNCTHSWILVRNYEGSEDFTVKRVIDCETGDEVPLSDLRVHIAAHPDTVLDVITNLERNNDSYDGVTGEWIECQNCDAIIPAGFVGEVDQEV